MTPAQREALEPYAILLVPTEGDPGGLLADEACGALPPMVSSRIPSNDKPSIELRDEWAVEHGRHAHGPRTRTVFALPLRWDGMPVPGGIFRAWQAWGPDEDPEFESTGWSTYDVLGEALDSAGAAKWLAYAVERCGRGSVVVLDLVDGRHVERAP